MIELKLDVDTLFEWQKHSQTATNVPHYQELLDFIDMRAQALEVSCASHKTFKRPPSRVTSHATHATHSHYCVGCKTEKHPLYVCPTFKSMPLDGKMQVLKTNRLCTNCLGGGHFKLQCKSVHKCKECQKSHHTLSHFVT